MDLIKKLAILFFALLLASCGTKTSSTKIQLSGAFAVGALTTQFNGGALVYGYRKGGIEKFQIPVNPGATDITEIDLPIGDYFITAIGWDGVGTNLEGSRYCSQGLYKVDSTETSIALNLKISNCASVTNVSAFGGSGDDLNIETCHGIVKHPGIGSRKGCSGTPGIIRSVKIQYLALYPDGGINESQNLSSECIPFDSGDEFLYKITNTPSNLRPIIANGGYFTPFRVIGFREAGCTGGQQSRVIPRNTAALTNTHSHYPSSPTSGVPTLLVGFDSCSIPGANESNQFANDNVSAVNSRTNSTDKNVICNVDQFNLIPDSTKAHYTLGATLDFEGSAPLTSSNIFKGKIVGDTLLKYKGGFHIKGQTENLFEQLFADGARVVRFDSLNIDASSITNGPIFSKTAKDLDVNFYDIKVSGEMVNNSSTITTTGTSQGKACGGFINYIDNNTLSSRQKFEQIEFSNFSLSCLDLNGSKNYQGGLVGVISPGSAITVKNANTSILSVNGKINLKNNSNATNLVIGGLIGMQENDAFLKASDLSYDFIYSPLNQKGDVISGLLGQHQSNVASQQGSVDISNANIHASVTKTAPYSADQGAGVTIGTVYNPSSIKISNVVTTGVIDTDLKNTGGLIGFADKFNELIVRDSLNFATIKSKGSTGGTVGSFGTSTQGTTSLKNIHVEGRVETKDGPLVQKGTGGVLGLVNSGSSSIDFKDILIDAEIISNIALPNDATGALIGIVNNTTLTINIAGLHYNKDRIIENSFPSDSIIGLFPLAGSSTAATTRIGTKAEVRHFGYNGFDSFISTRYSGGATPISFSTAFGVQPTLLSLSANSTPHFRTDGKLHFEHLVNSFIHFDGSGRATKAGTRNEPFILYSKADLLQLNTNSSLGFNWKLGNDINMYDSHFQVGQGEAFRGSFDGNFKKISRIKNDFSGLSHYNNGIFPKVYDAKISNLTIGDESSFTFDCDGSGYAGVLIGEIDTYTHEYDLPGIQISNIIIDDVSVDDDPNCIGRGAIAGKYSSGYGEQTFDIITVANSDFSSHVAFSSFIGQLDAQQPGIEFTFKNIEILNNKYNASGSSAFHSINSGSTFNVSYQNTLFISDTDNNVPDYVHTSPSGSATNNGNNFAFFPSSFGGGLDLSMLYNPSQTLFTNVDDFVYQDGLFLYGTPKIPRLNRFELLENN